MICCDLRGRNFRSGSMNDTSIVVEGEEMYFVVQRFCYRKIDWCNTAGKTNDSELGGYGDIRDGIHKGNTLETLDWMRKSTGRVR